MASLALQLLAARLPELASTLERLKCFQWFFSEHRRECQSKLSSYQMSGERWYEIVEVHFAEISLAVATREASVTTLHVSVVWAKIIKLLIINKDSSIAVFCRVLLLKYNFCLRNLMSFIEANVSVLALLPVRNIGFERAPAQCTLKLSTTHLYTAHELITEFWVFPRVFKEMPNL